MIELPEPAVPGFNVYRRVDLHSYGHDDFAIRQAIRRGQLVRLGRGTYCQAIAEDDTFARRLRQYQYRCVAYGLRSPKVILSHLSVASMCGLPADTGDVSVVHATVPGIGGGRCERDVRRHVGTISPGEWEWYGPLRVTTMARTLIDVARSEAKFPAVAMVDAALHQGLTTPDALTAMLVRCRNFPGMTAARRVCALVDGRSESVGETRCRLFFAENGLPQPELQVAVYSAAGDFLARTDFALLEFGVIVEFDGEVKYRQLLRPGESVSDAVLREKYRQDRIEDAGLVVVRVSWRDFQRPAELEDRIRAALGRGLRNMRVGVVTGELRVGPAVTVDHTAGLQAA